MFTTLSSLFFLSLILTLNLILCSLMLTQTYTHYTHTTLLFSFALISLPLLQHWLPERANEECFSLILSLSLPISLFTHSPLSFFLSFFFLFLFFFSLFLFYLTLCTVIHLLSNLILYIIGISKMRLQLSFHFDIKKEKQNWTFDSNKCY